MLSLFTKYAEVHWFTKPQALLAASTARESVGIWMKFTISNEAITVRIFFKNCSPFKKAILIPFLIIKRAGG